VGSSKNPIYYNSEIRLGIANLCLLKLFPTERLRDEKMLVIFAEQLKKIDRKYSNFRSILSESFGWRGEQ
jgi:hypothetical protein